LPDKRIFLSRVTGQDFYSALERRQEKETLGIRLYYFNLLHANNMLIF